MRRRNQARADQAFTQVASLIDEGAYWLDQRAYRYALDSFLDAAFELGRASALGADGTEVGQLFYDIRDFVLTAADVRSMGAQEIRPTEEFLEAQAAIIGERARKAFRAPRGRLRTERLETSTNDRVANITLDEIDAQVDQLLAAGEAANEMEAAVLLAVTAGCISCIKQTPEARQTSADYLAHARNIAVRLAPPSPDLGASHRSLNPQGRKNRGTRRNMSSEVRRLRNELTRY